MTPDKHVALAVIVTVMPCIVGLVYFLNGKRVMPAAVGFSLAAASIVCIFIVAVRLLDSGAAWVIGTSIAVTALIFVRKFTIEKLGSTHLKYARLAYMNVAEDAERYVDFFELCASNQALNAYNLALISMQRAPTHGEYECAASFIQSEGERFKSKQLSEKAANLFSAYGAS